MNEHFEQNGIRFVWNKAKARANAAKHRVTFEQASEAFFDPFLRVVDASVDHEARNAVVGMDERWNLLFVAHIAFENERIRIISARKATRSERRFYES